MNANKLQVSGWFARLLFLFPGIGLCGWLRCSGAFGHCEPSKSAQDYYKHLIIRTAEVEGRI